MELVVVDTSQIQPYIFGSNRLRENIGASYLVAQATRDWAREAMPQGAKEVYAGGGNFVALFQDGAGAKTFTSTLSRKALTKSPGLQLIIGQESFQIGEALYDKVEAAFKNLAEQKRSRPLSAPLLGLGVTAVCQSTGLPAIGMAPAIGNDPEYPASAEILAKLEAMSPANKRLREMFDKELGKDYDFPHDFDNLGRSHSDQSYIAVVHADGNGIGQRIKIIGEQYKRPEDNDAYKVKIGEFSKALEQASQKALHEVFDVLMKRIKQVWGDRIIHTNLLGNELAKIELKEFEENWGYYLPFRPIVFGGDDVTFVCDGRLGLSLAIVYLQAFEKYTTNLPDGEGPATACAGVAIVKTHYPFARAYALAEELCQSAKRYRRMNQDKNENKKEGSYLDWHFALSGLSGDIKEIRQREFTTTEGSLTLRPVALGENTRDPHRSWQVIMKGVEAFQDLKLHADEKKPHWSTRRNKIKALRDALRLGGEAVEQFLSKYNEGKSLPEVEPAVTAWPKRGWQGYYCGYFDAIELSDWFIPL
ncbi:hypothetical protein L0337_18840 [candidate division KSB1 bacterium]|nr:hypothetical protein [candidate division KSB1 bacterium]